MPRDFRGAVQSGLPVLLVGFAVLGLLVLALLNRASAATPGPAAVTSNYGPSPVLHPIGGPFVSALLAILIIAALLIALLLTRRRNGHRQNGNGKGVTDSSGDAAQAGAGAQVGEVEAESTNGDSLDATLDELDRLGSTPPE
jgi:hypothetical protein